MLLVTGRGSVSGRVPSLSQYREDCPARWFSNTTQGPALPILSSQWCKTAGRSRPTVREYKQSRRATGGRKVDAGLNAANFALTRHQFIRADVQARDADLGAHPCDCTIGGAGRPGLGRPHCRRPDSWHRERWFVDKPVKDGKKHSGDNYISEQDREWLADAVSVEVERVSQEQIGVAGRQEPPGRLLAICKLSRQVRCLDRRPDRWPVTCQPSRWSGRYDGWWAGQVGLSRHGISLVSLSIGVAHGDAQRLLDQLGRGHVRCSLLAHRLTMSSGNSMTSRTPSCRRVWSGGLVACWLVGCCVGVRW